MQHRLLFTICISMGSLLAAPEMHAGRLALGNIQRAIASCANPGPSLFAGSDTTVTNASTIQIHINTESPSTCSLFAGNSYWDMIVGPNSQKCGVTYAQNGWLIGQGGNTGPYYFEEINTVGTCDQGPDIWGTISGTNYFETQLTHDSLKEVNFWKDGSINTTDAMDWNTGTGYQIFAETHDPNDYFSTTTPVHFSGAVSCEGASQCNPHTSFVVQANPGSVTSSNATYDRSSSDTSTFDVCDTRKTSC